MNIQKKKELNTHGVTMVALVITIIVLIILAAVTMSILKPDNGIINNAMKGKEATELTDIKEEVKELWLEVENDTINEYYNNSELAVFFEEKLKDKDPKATAQYKEANQIFKINYKGNIFYMTENAVLVTEEPEATETPNVEIAENGQPKDTQVFAGNSTSINVSATGVGNVTYQWYSTDRNSTIGGTEVKNATTATLAFSPAQMKDDKYYYCEITSKNNGKNTKVKTRAVRVDVVERLTNDTVTVPETIDTVKEGETITIPVTINNPGGTISYQWYFNTENSNTGGTPVGTNSETFTKTAVASDTGYYYCVITQTVAGESNVVKTGTAKVKVLKILTVSFDAGTDITVDPATKSVVSELAYGELPTPVKDRYRFDGWFTAEEGGEQVTAETIVTQAQDHNLYAHWTQNVFTVKFKDTSRLPAEYQEVEYIESTGTQYIDTGVTPSENTKVLIKFELVDLIQNANVFTANWSTNGFAMITFNNKFRWHYNRAIDINFSVNSKTKYQMEVYRNNVVINDNVVHNSNSEAYKSPNDSIKLFGYINNTHMNKYKLYNFSTYENNILTSNLIPCKSTTTVTNVDNASCPSGTIGLYDTVEGKFYTNKGTGIFIAGDEVNSFEGSSTKDVTYGQAYGELPTPERDRYKFDGWFTAEEGGEQVTEETIVTTAQDHNLYAHWTQNVFTVKFKDTSRLPAEYQEVEYIESTGTQYIDTLYPLWKDNNWKIEYKFDVSQFYNYNNMFGSLDVTNTDNEIWINSNKEYYVRFPNTGKQFIATLNLNIPHTFIHDNTGSNLLNYVDGFLVKTLNKANTTFNHDLGFGHRTGSQFLKGKMYYLKFWNNEQLVRDMIPCYRISDSTVGLYDTVTDQFYTNKGTGTFIVGDEVNSFEGSSTKDVTLDQPYGELPEPTAPRHIFTGWYTAEEGGEEVTAETVVTTAQDHNLYARWEEKTLIELEETSGTAYINTPDKTVEIETQKINSLTVTSSNTSIATAEVSAVENNRATLTVHPVSPGTTAITVKDAESDVEATYTVTAEETNYYAGGGVHSTLNEAFTACTTAGTTEILVCRNVTDEGTALTIDSHNVDLNLRNFTVTRTNQITVNNNRALTITGTGTLTGSAETLINNLGTLNINSTGTITCSGSKTIENRRNLNITTDATIANTGNNTTSYPVYNNGGTIVMNNGTIAGVYYGIYNYSGNINMNGGSITTTGETGERYGIYVRTSTVTLTGTASVSGGLYGINQAGGTVNIGSTSETLSTQYPAVTGGTYGMNKTAGNWYLNNGIVKGTTEGFNVDPNARRNGYNIMYDKETINGVEYKTAYLVITLKQETVTNNANGAFLGTGITRNVIESISFTDSLNDFPEIDNQNCWDVSSLANSGEVLLWATDEDENGILDGKYKVVIGQKGGVKANTNSSYLFQYIGNTIDAEIELASFNTKCVTNMNSMFNLCKKVANLDVSGFDTSKVTTMGSMFSSCSSLTELDLSGFDTSKVTTMGSMFYSCSSLTELDLSGFDTGNVTNLSSMFFDCNSLTELDVSEFNTCNVTTMASMFRNCSNLTEIDVSGFDTSNVTNMVQLFYHCKSLTELDIGGFDTSNVTNMSYMFSDCSSLTELDLSGFDTDKVTNMEEMFSSSGLIEIDISRLNTSNVTNMSWMFSNCKLLTTIYIGDLWDTSKVTNSVYMFYVCSNLVGGAGTKIAGNPINATYARIDNPPDNPGYFTAAPLRLRQTAGEVEVDGEASIQIIGGNLGTITAVSSDANVASAIIDGTTLVVTGLSAGTATITVTEDGQGQTATYTVTVTEP